MARTVLVLFHKILANGNAAAVFLKLKGIGVSPAGYAKKEVPLKMFLRFSLLVVILSPVLNGVAQTITTYAGPPLPVLGALATTQYFDRTEGIAPDGAGGFCFSSSSPENRVYRVAADGVLSQWPVMVGIFSAEMAGRRRRPQSSRSIFLSTPVAISSLRM